MARLTYVYRPEDISYVNVGRRQMPVTAGDDNLMMIMDLNSRGLCIDSPQIRGKELEEFTRKFNLLTTEELHQSLEISSKTFVSVLNQCVQCVGCRRRVERLFYHLTLSGHPTLDPLVFKNSCVLSINEDKMKTPQALGTLLYRHHDILNNLVESKLRNKTRCVLHSLDAFRSKPFSETWRDVWSSMKHSCRDELAVIETKELHDVLENYLKKHKFCNGCRTKIEKAYKILVGESTTKEKGFVAALYSNIKKCHPDKHIHVFTNKIDFLDVLIRRAEPEVNGSYSKLRERHAKTLEIAQEEVLTCVGMIMYERLRRVYVSLREEERACQVLAAIGIHALCQSFDMSVEEKQGISNLELLYQEISRAEKAKEHKREQKKLKKKKKKSEKKNSHRACGNNNDAEEDVHAGTEDEELHEHNVTMDMVASTTSLADDGNETTICENADDDEDEEEEEEEYEDEEHDDGIIDNVGMLKKTSTAGQKMDDIEEDAGVDCDHLEDNHDEVDEKDADGSKHHKHLGGKVQSSQPNNQQQKKKKQKQKQKPKATTQKKNNSNANTTQNKTTNTTTANNNNNNKKKGGKTQNRAAGALRTMQADGTVKTTHSCQGGVAVTSTISNPAKCNDCHSAASECPCESDIKDSGYGSEPLSHGNSRTSSVVSSPEDTSEGSEVSCSDGFCSYVCGNGGDSDKKCLTGNFDDKKQQEHKHHNHHHQHHGNHNHDHYIEEGNLRDRCNNHSSEFNCGFNEPCTFFQQHDMNTLSLQQMLDDFDGDDEDEENCYIPQEVVFEYQCKREKVQQQRLQLRERLRNNFARLCMQRKKRSVLTPTVTIVSSTNKI